MIAPINYEMRVIGQYWLCHWNLCSFLRIKKRSQKLTVIWASFGEHCLCTLVTTLMGLFDLKCLQEFSQLQLICIRWGTLLVKTQRVSYEVYLNFVVAS